MKKKANNSQNDQQEQMIEKALNTGGFLFPKTVDEVKEFERIYGTTNVILPLELQEPDFLNLELENKTKTKVVKFPSENFAMAAREGSSKLPSEIQQKIIQDIKNSHSKKKKKRKQ
jgi:hypothetical protein